MAVAVKLGLKMLPAEACKRDHFVPKGTHVHSLLWIPKWISAMWTPILNLHSGWPGIASHGFIFQDGSAPFYRALSVFEG